MISRAVGLVTIIGATVALAGAAPGCGAVPGAGGVPSTASATRTDSPSPSSGTPAPSPPAGYKTAGNPTVMYSLFYPDTWFEERSFNPNSQDFSNENTGSPEGLDASGIWLDVGVVTDTARPCVVSASALPSGQTSRQVSIDGEPATLYVITAPPEAWVHVQHNGWCYAILFKAGSAEARDQHMGEFDQILLSFRFNR